MMKKCCICNEPFTIGFVMPNGDCVCADYTCCYMYCSIEGERIEQKVEEESE